MKKIVVGAVIIGTAATLALFGTRGVRACC